MRNKYRVNVVIEFDVEADNRAAAHIVAVDTLTAAELPGFDLVKVNHVGAPAAIDGVDHRAARETELVPGQSYDTPIGTYVVPDMTRRPDFSSLDPTPLDESTAREFLTESAKLHGID